MSEVYTPLGTGDLVLSYTNPIDDDGPPSAAQVATPLEGLMDDVARLAAGTRALTTGGRYLPLSRICYCIDAATQTAQWFFDPGSPGVWTQLALDTTAGHHERRLAMPLELPTLAQLTQVRIRVLPVTHVGLPATMPNIELVKYNPFTGTHTSLANVDDTSASIGAYNAEHTITIAQANMPSGDPIDITRDSEVYEVRITGEGGANSIVGLKLKSFSVSYSTAFHDPGAG